MTSVTPTIDFFSRVSAICVCLFLINFVLCFNVINSTDDFRSQRQKKQISSDDTTFRCKNGKIIDAWLVCDGIANCADSSDESAEQCKNVPCPSFSFRCAYGACIDAALKCNGKSDCADRSDESSSICVVDTLVNTVCNNTQFQCINQQCIDINLLCDGKRDCIDGSDETFNRCHNTPCNTYLSFRCNYGACVDGSFKCDGKVQCADGSDESERTCNKPTPKPSTTSTTTVSAPLPEGYCVIPLAYVDKAVVYKCQGAQKTACIKNGGTAVTESTKATFSCKPGYHRLDNKNITAICLDGQWQPELPKCDKVCDKLTPINVDLTCYRSNNATADCNGPLIAGDRVRPTCKLLHIYKDFVPIYQELVCQEDGRWDNILFSCVPECGRQNTNALTLIFDGTSERFGDSPWHVAIYDITKTLLICGGTIINPYLILSAAHCFHDRLNQQKLPAKNYEIVVAKYTRNYANKDNSVQKTFKIKEIRFSNKGYFATQTYFANDIAILILEGKLDISPSVLPACVDWIHTEKYSPPEGTPGKVVGWGVNELGKLSENLTTANLPFISNSRCIRIVPDDFKPYITYDKFCAGSEKGPGVLQGDSGGGLLFREGLFYYVRGIVSLKQPSATPIAAFTDISDHITWILNVRNEVEQEILRKESTLPARG